MTFLKIPGQLMRHPLIKLYHLSNLLQMPNDCRMAYVEYFGNFSCSCKRISFDDVSQLLSASNGWPLEVDSDQLRRSSKLSLLQLHEKLLKNSTSAILWFGIWHWQQIGKVKKLNKWVPHELTTNQKLSF